MRKKMQLKLLLLIIILMINLLSFTVYADNLIKIDIRQAIDDDTVTYSICIPEKSEISALQLDILYDTKVLEYSSVKTYPLYESGIGQINDTEVSKVSCAFISLTPLNKPGDFIELSFKCLDKTKISSKMVSFDFIELANSDGKKINHTIHYLSFTNSTTDQQEHNNSDNQSPQNTTPTSKDNNTTDKIPNNNSNSTMIDVENNDTFDHATSSNPTQNSNNNSSDNNQIIMDEQQVPEKKETIKIDNNDKCESSKQQFTFLWILLFVVLTLLIIIFVIYIINKQKERKK